MRYVLTNPERVEIRDGAEAPEWKKLRALSPTLRKLRLTRVEVYVPDPDKPGAVQRIVVEGLMFREAVDGAE